MSLLSLPQEILSQILSYLEPRHVTRVGRTCRTARDFVTPANQLLWQAVFLQVFDDPRQAWTQIPQSRRRKHIDDVESRWDWHRELRRRSLALKAVDPQNSDDFARGDLTVDDIAQTLLDIIVTAKSQLTEAEVARGATPQIDDRSSLNLQHLTSAHENWSRLEDFIQDHHLGFVEDDEETKWLHSGRPITRSRSLALQRVPRLDAQCRLHVLYGLTEREKDKDALKGHARRMVYDWNHPVPANDYGPFMPDGCGEINWPLLEALMFVILKNFEICVEGRLAIPPGFYYSIPHRTLADPTVPEDWANATGSWVGTYSFLDYADLFHYNTWVDTTSRPNLEQVPEACGDLMKFELKLDPSLRSDPKLQSSLPACGDLPALYFSGESSSYDPFGHPRLQIGFKGRVSLCPSGHEVRWRYIISYRGQDQWQLEGVQPGGIRSGPVYGVWTQWGHEEHAPVGSFMYVQESLCKKQELVLSVNRRQDSSSGEDD